MAVKVRGVSFAYSGNNVLDDFSLTVEKGKVYCLLGRNGSGKTTLLKMLNGILVPDTGRILVDELDILNMSRKKIARKIGFVPQEHSGIFDYSVLEMVVMGRNPHLGLAERPGKKDYAIAREALKLVNLDYLCDRSYMEVSGGEKQMVFIARTIAQEVPYFVLDEPTSHLDFFNQREILKNIRSIVKKRDCGALIAMHDPNLAICFGDEVIMIKEGRLLQQGRTGDVITKDNLKDLYGLDVDIAQLPDGRKVIVSSL